MFCNVLEQFEITQFDLRVLFDETAVGQIYWQYKKVKDNINYYLLLLSFHLNVNFNLNVHLEVEDVVNILMLKPRYISSYLFVCVIYIYNHYGENYVSPNIFASKNYIFSRLTFLSLKYNFTLKKKSKFVFFFNFYLQFLKIKIQVVFQDIVKANFGRHYPFYSRLLNFYPFFMIYFFFLSSENLNGLLFFGFANTAFVCFNFVESFNAIVGLTSLSWFLRSTHFYKMFVPSDVPGLILPFLVGIELISHIAKLFSLAIRLFANMMSGHVLLHILTGFSLSLSKVNLVLLVLPLLIIAAIILLEYSICILQGYVFLTLLSIFYEEHLSYSKVDMILFVNRILMHGKKVKLVLTTLLIKLFFLTGNKGRMFFYKLKKKGFTTFII